MSNPEVPIKSGSAVTEGLLVAIASAVAYLLAFYYEKGFTSYFKIPTHFVGVGIVNIFIVIALAISFLLFILPTADFIFALLRRLHPVLYPLVSGLLFMSLFLVMHLYLFGLSNWPLFIVHLVVLFIIVFIALVLPMIAHRKKGKVLERLEEQQNLDRSHVGIFDVMATKFGRSSVLVIAFSLLSINFAENAGRAQAMKQTEFLVVSTEPEMVVLQIYGDSIICAPFKRETKEVETRFRIMKIAEDSKLALNLEKVGPLRPVEFKLPTPLPSPSEMPSQTPTVSPTNEPQATP